MSRSENFIRTSHGLLKALEKAMERLHLYFPTFFVRLNFNNKKPDASFKPIVQTKGHFHWTVRSRNIRIGECGNQFFGHVDLVEYQNCQKVHLCI